MDMHKDDGNIRDTPKQCRPTSPKSPLNKSCNSNHSGETSKMDAAMGRVRSIYETTKERTEYLPEPTLNSIGLLPDGAITIKEGYGAMPTEPVPLYRPRVISKKPPISNRMPQMTRLSAGLRETKSSSLRMIRDPEEVLRFKRKLMAGTSQSHTEMKSGMVPSNTKPCNVEITSKYTTLERFKTRSLGPDELIDIEDIPFDTLAVMEKLIPEVDQGNMKNTEQSTTLKSPEQKDKEKRKDLVISPIVEDCVGSGEIFNSTVSDLTQSLLPVEKESPVLTKDTFTETKPDGIGQCHDNTRGDIPSSIKTDIQADKKEKKKKKKSKMPFKWLQKSKAEKIVPLPVKDDDPLTKPRSKTDLERIATMFCVETPQQAGLRRFLSGQGYVGDEVVCFKPGVWDCDIRGHEDDEQKKSVRKCNASTDVDVVENGIKNINLKNKGQSSDNTAVTGLKKMQRRLRKLTKSAK